MAGSQVFWRPVFARLLKIAVVRMSGILRAGSSILNTAATVKDRDMGDARLTTHFYAFIGDQGDIFVSVVTKNFSGDIDIFLVDGLRPLTKMVIYADGGVNETGRLIYLRKPEKLLLRVE